MKIPNQTDSVVMFFLKYVLFTFYNILCLKIFKVVANKHIVPFLVFWLSKMMVAFCCLLLSKMDKFLSVSSLNSKESHGPQNLS